MERFKHIGDEELKRKYPEMIEKLMRKFGCRVMCAPKALSNLLYDLGEWAYQEDPEEENFLKRAQKDLETVLRDNTLDGLCADLIGLDYEEKTPETNYVNKFFLDAVYLHLTVRKQHENPFP